MLEQLFNETNSILTVLLMLGSAVVGFIGGALAVWSLKRASDGSIVQTLPLVSLKPSSSSAPCKPTSLRSPVESQEKVSVNSSPMLPNDSSSR